MPTEDARHRPSEPPDGLPPIQCSACRSVLRSHGREAVSFLLLDQLTIPIVGCDAHLERFASVCEFTTEESGELLDHHPAGGINCPGCRLAPHNPEQPLVPVESGAVAILACPQHQSEIIERYHSGRQTQQQLTASLDTV